MREEANPYHCFIGGKPHPAYLHSNMGASLYWCPVHGLLLSMSGCGLRLKTGKRNMTNEQYGKFVEGPRIYENLPNDLRWLAFNDVDYWSKHTDPTKMVYHSTCINLLHGRLEWVGDLDVEEVSSALLGIAEVLEMGERLWKDYHLSPGSSVERPSQFTMVACVL